jgi:hypothetical protein
MNVTRRRVLAGLGGAAVAGVAVETRNSAAIVAADPVSTPSSWRASLVGIGDAYVRQQFESSDAVLRTDRVNHALARLGIERQAAVALLASGGGGPLRAAVRDDFDRGRTTHVGDWVLSVTEVAVAVAAWGEESSPVGTHR